MSTKLYQKCPACGGTRKTTFQNNTKLPRPGSPDLLAVFLTESDCPCCTDGYTEFGFTLEECMNYAEKALKESTSKIEQMGSLTIATTPSFDGTYPTTGEKRARFGVESVPGEETK